MSLRKAKLTFLVKHVLDPIWYSSFFFVRIIINTTHNKWIIVTTKSENATSDGAGPCWTLDTTESRHWGMCFTRQVKELTKHSRFFIQDLKIDTSTTRRLSHPRPPSDRTILAHSYLITLFNLSNTDRLIVQRVRLNVSIIFV